MISVEAKLECDACGRAANVKLDGIGGLVNLSVIAGSLGWERFMRGMTLCSECVQNEEQLQRVKRIQSVVLPRQNPIRVGPPNPLRKGWRSDAAILDAYRNTKTMTEAARKLGMTRTGFYARIERMKEKGLVDPQLNGEANHEKETIS